MSMGQVADSPCLAVPCKRALGRGCANSAVPPATGMNRDFYLFSIGHTQWQPKLGLASEGNALVCFLLRSCRAQQTRKRIVPAPLRRATVVISCQSAKIWTELGRTLAVDRSFRRADTLRFFAPADLRTTETKPRCLKGRERGMGHGGE